MSGQVISGGDEEGRVVLWTVKIWELNGCVVCVFLAWVRCGCGVVRLQIYWLCGFVSCARVCVFVCVFTKWHKQTIIEVESIPLSFSPILSFLIIFYLHILLFLFLYES